MRSEEEDEEKHHEQSSEFDDEERIQVAPNMEASGSLTQATWDPEEEEEESQEEELREESGGELKRARQESGEECAGGRCEAEKGARRAVEESKKEGRERRWRGGKSHGGFISMMVHYDGGGRPRQRLKRCEEKWERRKGD